MANLETLELTIQANAESAREGIDSLIHSLSELSGAITKPYSDVCDFNSALKEMKELSSGIKFGELTKATKAITALKETKSAKGTPLSAEEAEDYVKSMIKLDVLRKKQSGTLTDLGKALGATKENEYRIGTLAERYHKLADSIEKVDKESKKITESAHPNGVNNIDVSKLTFPNKVSDEEWGRKYAQNLANEYSKRANAVSEGFASYFRGETNTNGGGRYFSNEIKRYKELRAELGDEGFAKKVGMSVDDMKQRFQFIVDNFDKTASSLKESNSAAKAQNDTLKETASVAKNAGEATKEFGNSSKTATKSISNNIKSITKYVSGSCPIDTGSRIPYCMLCSLIL